jgi:phosphate transport system permease protein
MAVPLGIVTAVALYEVRARAMRWLRLVLEVMVGMPSILFGIFVFLAVVQQMGHQLTLLAGSIALAILMIPLVAVSCEDALRNVPVALVEAAFALGARPSKIMARVVFPAARTRILTGVLLALSRAVGETAPVAFVIGTALTTNWNPASEASTLPTAIFNTFGSYLKSQANEVWGIALVLMVSVLAINVVSRVIVARADRGGR